ncbi:hydroxyisourate hydrolase [Frateuria aurantia]|uniref:5-hydroxyisourate hydrolase n=1 Tax=Frateuria aurantia (strain ATCC 33424 / DSM 6220 / KCTC 2777 / LMG 1558 / NBRC 3245 / NCIMB 13370) TaxID=767434 RepID=H8L3J9_FRAAD|nr:hydroxyisourate hydrolase [Frateuria aurantia]AFC87368.1 hydroxyisourate hydrolase [Frateuria aurantia DSM 6220]
MSRLTTHILDTSHGRPAAGVMIELFRLQVDGLHPLTRQISNADGRCEHPLLEGESFQLGRYQLHFHIGDYFDQVHAHDERFLDVVILAFAITDTSRAWHLPLLCSPWSYSTYRGS